MLPACSVSLICMTASALSDPADYLYIASASYAASTHGDPHFTFIPELKKRQNVLQCTVATRQLGLLRAQVQPASVSVTTRTHVVSDRIAVVFLLPGTVTAAALISPP